MRYSAALKILNTCGDGVGFGSRTSTLCTKDKRRTRFRHCSLLHWAFSAPFRTEFISHSNIWESCRSRISSASGNDDFDVPVLDEGRVIYFMISDFQITQPNQMSTRDIVHHKDPPVLSHGLESHLLYTQTGELNKKTPKFTRVSFFYFASGGFTAGTQSFRSVNDSMRRSSSAAINAS